MELNYLIVTLTCIGEKDGTILALIPVRETIQYIHFLSRFFVYS